MPSAEQALRFASMHVFYRRGYAKSVAAQCEHAYSFDRYRSWTACAEALLDMGFDKYEVVEILCSKIPRWAGDSYNGNARYGKLPASAITDYIRRCQDHSLRDILEEAAFQRARIEETKLQSQ